MDTQWHYLIDEEQKGPVTTQALLNLRQSGVVNARTHVWKQGMGEWVPMSEIPELAEACRQPRQTSSGPPPLPENAPHPLHEGRDLQKEAEEEEGEKQFRKAIAMLIGFIAIIVGVIVYNVTKPPFIGDEPLGGGADVTIHQIRDLEPTEGQTIIIFRTRMNERHDVFVVGEGKRYGMELHMPGYNYIIVPAGSYDLELIYHGETSNLKIPGIYGPFDHLVPRAQLIRFDLVMFNYWNDVDRFTGDPFRTFNPDGTTKATVPAHLNPGRSY